MRYWLVGALVLVLGLAGCGSSPKTQFFALDTVPPAAGATARVDGKPLQVGHVALPGTLDRAALVTTGPGPQINVSDVERWAAPLDGMTQRVLAEDLQARLGVAAVLAPGDPPPSGGARTVVLNVQRFGADSTGQVVLEADWTVATGSPPHATGLHHVRIVENAGSTEGAAVASAMSRALGALADDIAHKLPA